MNRQLLSSCFLAIITLSQTGRGWSQTAGTSDLVHHEAQSPTHVPVKLPTLASAEEAKSPSPVMTILVYNKAQAPAATLAQAELEVGRILGEAGVRAVWVDCLDRHSGADPQRLCSRPREPADLVLRLLPGQAQNRFSDSLFGISFLPTLAS